MKNIITIATILLMYVNSFSQVTILDEKDMLDPTYGDSGFYYKDLNNTLTPFVGTYLYTNGNTSFKIILKKKLNSPIGTSYSTDMLIGGYKYVENGVVKVDVLNNVNTNLTDGRDHKIYARQIMTGDALGCSTCLSNEKWVVGSIKDPVSGSVDRIFIRKTILSGGVQAIKIKILHSISARSENDPTPPPISYPLSQEFILLKQPF